MSGRNRDYAAAGIGPASAICVTLLLRSLSMSRFVGLLLLCAVGCSQGPDQPLPLYPVTGSVKVGGKPLAEVAVQLIPVDEKTRAKPGIGKTDKDGNFTITTNGDRGANAGKFKVVLGTSSQQQEQKMSSMSYEEQQKARYAASEKFSGDNAKTKGVAKTGPEFPKEWTNAKTTPKEVEIINKAIIVNVDI